MSDTALTDIDPSEVEQDTPPKRGRGRRFGELAPPSDDPAVNERRRKDREYRAALKQRKGGGAARSDAKPRSSGKRNLTGEIEAMLSLVASVWVIRDPECATVLDAQSHDIAAGLNAWAQRDPNVYKMLSRWLDGGGAGALAFALWPLGLQLANHHVLPAIERRRELIAERQAAFDETWAEPEPIATEVEHLGEAADEAFIPPNIAQD